MAALLATVLPSDPGEGGPGPWVPPALALSPTPAVSPGLRATVTGHPALRRDDCPRRLDQWTNHAYPPPRCGANTCPPCARFKALQAAEAIALTAPSFEMTFTRVGKTFRAIQGAFEQLRQSLKRRFPMKLAWVVECNDQGRPGHDHHIHAAAYGRVPDRARLSEKAQAVGFGEEVHVAAMRNAEWFGEYLLKQVRDGDLQHHLDMNGSRLLNASKGFWRLGNEPITGGLDGLLAEHRSRTGQA